MKDLIIKVNKKGAVTINELVKVLEESNDPQLNLVRNSYPYKIPQGYMSWRSLSAIISMGIVGLETGKTLLEKDYATYLHSHKAALWFTQSAPIYCVKPDILESMLNTDILNSESVLADLESSIPTFILLFPKGSIISSENSPLNFVIVHLSDKTKPEYSQGEKFGVNAFHLPHDHSKNLHWSGLDQDGTVWFTGAGLHPDGRIEVKESGMGKNKIDKKDDGFIKKVRSIVLQVLLLLQYEPEVLADIQPETEIKKKPTGFNPSHNQTNSIKYLYPRWIEEPKRKVSNRTKIDSQKSHASPITHWRRGHWRLQHYGEGNTLQKWVRIAPTLVNP